MKLLNICYEPLPSPLLVGNDEPQGRGGFNPFLQAASVSGALVPFPVRLASGSKTMIKFRNFSALRRYHLQNQPLTRQSEAAPSGPVAEPYPFSDNKKVDTPGPKVSLAGGRTRLAKGPENPYNFIRGRNGFDVDRELLVACRGPVRSLNG